MASAGGTVSADSPNVCLVWNNSCLQAIRATKPGPPIVARSLAIVHTAMFDAWAAYDRRAVGTRLGGSLRRPVYERSQARISEAVSFAAYRALVDLFPPGVYPAGQSPPFAAQMTALGYDPANTTTDASRPAGIGNVVAQAVLTFRHSDGANQLGNLTPSGVPYADYTGYTPANAPDGTLAGLPDPIADPDRWQPLMVPDGQGGFVTQHCVAPYMGRVTPFALSAYDQFPPAAGPATHTDALYRSQARQILDDSAGLNDLQKVVAEYWADGPTSELPPGHWSLFGQFVSLRDGHTLGNDIRMFFALTNAVMDAGIACWGLKNQYDSVRPVTAVHHLFSGKPVRAWAGPFQGTRTFDGALWRPYQASTVVTPPFQEFLSGHSTFSAAAAEVLERHTGSDAFGSSVTVPAGSSKFEPGLVPAGPITLSWSTFSAAADQAGLSRRYGGIHFRTADMAGRAMGRLVGAQAFAKAQTYVNGNA